MDPAASPMTASLPPLPQRSPTLRLFQALAVACLKRDALAAQQGMRMLLELADDRESESILRLLVNSLSPQERFWFASLHGPRIGLVDPARSTGKLQAA